MPYPSTGQGYPPNIHGDYYPAQNPYFGSIGPNGLNLGLLNVNPLLSVQVSKTEYGDKVVKPLVNLHVTPNANIFEKIGDIFKKKPEYIYNSHYHHHDHFSTGPGHIEHFDHSIETPPHHFEHYSSEAPSFSYEMFHSKPIFEYHSSSGNVPPISTPEHFHPTDIGFSNSHEYTSKPVGALNSFNSQENGYNYNEPINSFSSFPSQESGYDYSAPSGGSPLYERSANQSQNTYKENEYSSHRRGKQLGYHHIPTPAPGAAEGSHLISFPNYRRRRSLHENKLELKKSVLVPSVEAEEVKINYKSKAYLKTYNDS